MEIQPSAVAAKAVNLRLRTHYVVLAIGLCIIPLLLVGLLTYESLSTRLTRFYAQTSGQTNSVIASNLMARFELLRSKVQTLAELPPVMGLIRAQDGLGVDLEQGLSAQDWSDRFTPILRAIGANDRSIRSIRLVSQNERVLAREDFRDGVVVPAQSVMGYEPSDDPAYTNTHRMADGHVYVSQLLRGIGQAKPQESIVSISLPIRYQGRSRAVMILDVQANVLLAQLSGPLPWLDVVLADSHGRYVAVGEMAQLERRNAGSFFADWPGLDPRRLDITQYSTSRGRELTATLIDVNPGGVASFWMVGVVRSGVAVTTTMSDLAGQAVQWMLVVALLGISIALLIAEHKRKPILDLAQTLRRARAGESDARAKVTSKDEFQEVAYAVNDLLESVQAQHKALLDARILAAEGTRAKALLFANLCKEISAPSRDVREALNQLTQSSLDSDQRDRVLSAIQSIKVLTNALDDVVVYASIEAGQQHLDLAAFDLRRLAEECVGASLRGAQEKGLELISYLPADLPVHAVGDAGRIRQVLGYLLSSALARTEKGEVTLTLRTHPESGGRFTVRFEIKDSAPPLSDQARKTFFNPQVHVNLDGQPGPGTGLGLSICQRLIQLMNGELDIDNGMQSGNVLWVELPLRNAEGRVAAPPELSEPSDTRKAQAFAGVRVLLAEDNLVNQQVTLYSLRRLGINVVTVANGRDALEQCAYQRFDLILMDCQMPEVDGIVATRQIRDREKVAGQGGAPIIAMTADALPDERERCLAAGANDCLVKPFDQAQLRSLLNQWLSGTPRAERESEDAEGATAP